MTSILKKLNPGDELVLQDLTSNTTLNGSKVYFVSFSSQSERCIVMQKKGGKRIKVKPHNLESAISSSPSTMAHVTEQYPISTSNSDVIDINYNGTFEADQGLLDMTKSLSAMGLYNDADSEQTDRAIACYLQSEYNTKKAITTYIDTLEEVGEVGGKKKILN